MSTEATVDGTCDPRFRTVREAFRSNFAELDELGAALSVRLDGRSVVDLWGGHTDPDRRAPWRHDSLVNIYSVGKGILSILTLILVERGILDLDERVAVYWPEYARANKQDTTLRMLLAHRAGQPAVRNRLPHDAMFQWTMMCDELAGQKPYWEPGSTHGYHVNTFGFLVGEVIRRATELDVGRALQHYLAGPLGAEVWFGLPEQHHRRAAHVTAPDVTLTTTEEWAVAFPPTGNEEHDFMIWHTYFNPPGLSGMGVVNSAAWRSSQIPSTSGQGDARAVSAVYDLLLSAERERISADAAARPALARELTAEASRTHSEGADRVLGRPSRFGLGLQLPHPGHLLEPIHGAVGHMGYGGSIGFADRDRGIAFGYLTNKPGERWHVPRPQRLIEALYSVLG